MDRQMDRRTNVTAYPCVLQDIGPLGPLPCSHSTSSLDHSKQGIGYCCRWLERDKVLIGAYFPSGWDLVMRRAVATEEPMTYERLRFELGF